MLNRFHQKCLRRILKIHLLDFVSDIENLKKSGCLKLECLIINNQICWSGHLVCMNDDKPPKCLFYGEFANRKCPQHEPRKRCKDFLKDNLKSIEIDVKEWERKTLDRNNWC